MVYGIVNRVGHGAHPSKDNDKCFWLLEGVGKFSGKSVFIKNAVDIQCIATLPRRNATLESFYDGGVE